jgi:hypothetical protein
MRKSASQEHATKYVREVDSQKYRQWREAHDQWRQEMAEWDKNKEGPRPEEPGNGSFVVDDITIEAVAKRLTGCPMGLLKVVDELDEFFLSFTQYGSAGKSNESKYLKLYDGGTLIVDRVKSEGQARVDNALMSICGTTQPFILSQLLDIKRHQSGFTQRWIFARPTPKLRVMPAKNDQYLHRLNRAKEAYRTLCHQVGNMGPSPDPMRPDPAAQRLLDQDIGDREVMIDCADPLEKSRMSKAQGLVPRYALLHAVCRLAFEHRHDLYVTREDVEKGIVFADWVLRESRRIGGSLEKIKHTHSFDDVMALILSGGQEGVTVRDLMTSNRKRFPKKEDASAALAQLVAMRRVIEVNKVTGGRPKTVFVATSLLNTEHRTQKSPTN